MLAAVVKEIAPGVLGQRMNQQWTLGIAGQGDQFRDRLEILARLLVIPGGSSRREPLQLKNGTRRDHMAGNAARVPGALGQENRLQFGFEVVIVKRTGLAGGSAGTRLAQQAKQQS